MRTIIIDRTELPRPVLVTPKKGTQGDLCHEEDAAGTSIEAIMRKYSCNLADLVAWRNKPLVGGDATIVTDLQEALEKVRDIPQMIGDLDLPENLSLGDIRAALESGDYSALFPRGNKQTVNKEVTHETTENQSKDV